MAAHIFGKWAAGISAKTLSRMWSFWAPFWGAKISVDRISDDFKEVDVSMKLGLKNRNIVGTHFGGSLYSMTDPFYMVMLMQILGKGYIVWDKSAEIRFKKPGKNKVKAEFRITEEDLSLIHEEIEKSDRGTYLYNKKVEVFGEEGELVCEVDKVIYIKKKPPKEISKA